MSDNMSDIGGMSQTSEMFEEMIGDESTTGCETALHEDTTIKRAETENTATEKSKELTASRESGCASTVGSARHEDKIAESGAGNAASVTPEKTSAYEEPAAGGGEAPGHRTDAESEAPEILKEPHDANDKPLAEHNEAPSRHSSGKSVDVVDNGKVIIQQPKASSSSEPIREPVKSKARPSRGKQDRVASLPSGINLDNVIKLKKAGPEVTPPTSSATTSSYSLRNRGAKQGKLAYDVKYHPMDDLIRPSQAAKRRSAHGEDPISSDNSSEAYTIIETDAAESIEEESEAEEQRKPTKNGKKRSQAQSWARTVEGTRRSTRKISDPKTSYNMDIHPQDKFLVISSDDEEVEVSAKKRRKLTRSRPKNDSSSDDEDTEQKQAQSTHHLDSSHSNDDAAALSVETGNDKESAAIIRTSSPISSVATPPSYGIRRKEGLKVWNMQPGERYFRHDRDAWPVSPGQPFQIFNEKLEDQLAREAMEASPLNYEHDDKENDMNTAELDSLPDMYGGISVMPASQWRQSNEDRQLSGHYDLVNEALYDDPPALSYGLDGTHGGHEDPPNGCAEGMELLVSGGHLPKGQTQEEAQIDTQDSVLGPNVSSETLASADSVMGH